MLLWRELKKVMVSVPYLLFVAVIVFGLFSQGALDFREEELSEPLLESGNYGTKYEEIPEIIMPAVLQKLISEFQENSYTTYPIGFYKKVKLNEQKQMRIAEIISDLTGIDKNEIYQLYEKLEPDVSQDQVQQNITVREDIAYSEFKEHMQEVDDILGGGSSYEAESLIGYGTVPISYEEAKDRYELVKNYDKMTGGYARLFSDYAVAMVMSVLPVFLAVIMSMKDGHAKMQELIFARNTSGVKIVFMRYLAVVISAMLPILVLSYISNGSVWDMYRGMELDYFAPLKYDFGWILPSVLISAAVGMCLTELTNTPIAVAAQGLWWFFDINVGIKSVASSYSLFRLAPRHNAGTLSFFRTQDYLEHFQSLLANRLLFTGLALLLITITVAIYDMKRRGRFHGSYKIRKALAGFRNR